MIGIIKKQFILPFIFLFVLGLFFTNKANAASLANISDTISTSRPSASAPLAAAQTAGATQATVVDLPATLNNSALWLASDSAVFQFDTGQTLNSVNVASMSAANTPSANQKILYLTSTITNAHHQGTAVFTSVTATHSIRFTTSSNVPGSGHVIISFPVPASNANIASPSATGFSFNGMTASNPTDVKFNGVTCTSVTVTAASGTIDCLVNASGITGGTAVTVLVGCTTGTTSCTVFSPRLINPTKGATAAGTADTWKISIATTDTTANGGTVLDSAKAIVGTIEAVQVQGTVEPSLTFTIAGLPTGTNITTQNASCTGGDITNPGTGLDATATFVNLGSLANGGINISAQELTISTNGAAGYSITATSSGRFINPASGFWISDANGGNGLTANDTPAPAVLPLTGNPAFGIHPCGADVTSGTWANAATAFNSGAKYSNPWNTGTNGFYANIASYNAPASARKTEIEYAATVGSTTPAGIYSNYFTYVATAVF